MSKDLKIGMIIGVVLLIAATLVISFLSEGSLRARLGLKFNKDASIDKPDDSNKNEDETPNPTPAVAPPETGEKIHYVTEGQTINEIANKYYGNPMMINKIVDENPQIPDNNELKTGMKLKIPE
jgi:nucleoid-associated protein YgaU